MANDTPAVKVTIRLSRSDAVSFLERLARNKDFREEYEGNPREVLAAHGIEIDPPDAIPPRAVVPPAAEIERALNELTEGYTATAPFPFWWPFAPFLGLLSVPETGGPEQEA